MATARLPAIFVLILQLQSSYGQQRGLVNKPCQGLNANPVGLSQGEQRKPGFTFKFNPIPGNIGANFNLQQLGNLQLSENVQQSSNLQSINLQQSQNCQQPQNIQQTGISQQSLNLQKPLNCQQPQNVQQSGGLQQSLNLQQPLYCQQPENIQQSLNLQQPLNCQQPQNIQQSGSLQQSLNLQQPLYCQQPENIQQSLNLQQPLNCQQPQNLQQLGNSQKSINLQQPINCQPSQNLQQPLNVQLPLNTNLQQILNQNLQLPLNLQQKIVQQQPTATIPQCDSQITTGQQTPIQTTDIPLASLPMINVQFSGLPSQVSQGVLLTNLGLTSSLPSLLPNSCGTKQANEQSFYIIPQNNAASASVGNLPISASDRSQNLNSVPFSSLSLSSSGECTTSNNPSTVSMVIPLPLQNYPTYQQNQQAKTCELAQNSFDQNQPMQSQLAMNSLQLQPVSQVQAQPVVKSVQNPSSLLSSLLMSQLQSPNSAPQYTRLSSAFPLNSIPTIQSSKQGSKSSNIKALLPLLFNLLKDKNGCGCQPNYNCECKNKNNNNLNKMNNIQEPQIFSGYSNKVDYSQADDASISNTGSQESESDGHQREPKTYQKYKSRDCDSAEIYEAEDDYVEDENDD